MNVAIKTSKKACNNMSWCRFARSDTEFGTEPKKIFYIFRCRVSSGEVMVGSVVRTGEIEPGWKGTKIQICIMIGSE